MARQILTTAMLLLVLCLTACSGGRGDVAERKEERAYSVDFTSWNGVKNHELLLEKDDTLRVEIVQNGGSIGLDIRREDGYEAYTGSRLNSCAFTVGTPEAGRYIVTVTGEDADGSVELLALSEDEAK